MKSSRENAPDAWGSGTGAWGWGTIAEPADELIERLSSPLVSAETVAAIVQQCHRDLDTTPPPPPEAVEQLARERLLVAGHDLNRDRPLVRIHADHATVITIHPALPPPRPIAYQWSQEGTATTSRAFPS